MKIFSVIVFGLLVYLIFNQTVSACSCFGSDMPDCVRAKESDAVFIGRITKIEINPVNNRERDENTIVIPTKWVYFDVEHQIKGSPNLKTRVLTTHGTSCDFGDIKTGQRWLVFAGRGENGDLGFGMCGGSYQIRNKNNIPQILSELSPDKKGQIISGTIGNYILGTPNIDVFIEGQSEKFQTKTTISGFIANVSSPGKYKVRAVVPFSARFSSYGDETKLTQTTGENESSVEYEVELAEGDCVFNIISMTQVDLKATGSISGRALNFTDDQKVDNYVYLFRLGATESETLDKYQTLERMKNGEFKFSGLREGTYVLAVNPNNFPERSKPFLRAYLPGTSDFSATQVIKLEQGQEISDIVFDLPNHLPQQTVTIEIVLPNGKPVTHDLRRGEDVFSFILYNPNKIWNSNSLDSVEYEICDFTEKGLICDDSLNPDGKGKYTFQAFTGFTYVLEVEIENSKGKTKHAFAFFTVEENMKPLRVVVNRDGEGDVNEFVKPKKNKPTALKN